MVQISKKDHHLDCIRPPFRKLFICPWFTFGCLMVPGLAELLPAHRGTLVKAGSPGYVFILQNLSMYVMHLCTLLSFTLPFLFDSFLICLCSESSCEFTLICQCFPLYIVFVMHQLCVCHFVDFFVVDFSVDSKQMHLVSLSLSWLVSSILIFLGDWKITLFLEFEDLVSCSCRTRHGHSSKVRLETYEASLQFTAASE